VFPPKGNLDQLGLLLAVVPARLELPPEFVLALVDILHLPTGELSWSP